MIEFIISQILGGIALIFVCISYFCNKKAFLFIQTLANIFYASSFLVSLSLVAGINTFISIIRTIVFYVYETKNKKIPIYYLLLFSALYVTIGICFFKNYWDVLTTISPILFTVAMMIKKMIVVKYTMLAPNLLLAIYSLSNKFYTSSLLSFIEIFVIIIAIFNYYIKKYRVKKNFDKKDDLCDINIELRVLRQKTE